MTKAEDPTAKPLSRKSQAGALGCTRGVAAVEFALVALPVFLLIAAIIEVSIFLIVQFELEAGVLDGARQIQLGAFRPGTTSSVVKTEICRKIRMIPNCTTAINVDVRSAPDFKSIGMPSVLSVGPTTPGGTYTETYNIGDRGSASTLIATYDQRLIFARLVGGYFGNVAGLTGFRRIYATSVFAIEQYP